jgi:hypothetical protein
VRGQRFVAWPNNPFDKFEACGICEENILVSAHDASRVKAYVDSTELGACHIDCVIKMVKEDPPNLGEC